MDRMEEKYDALAGQFSTLAQTVTVIAREQGHQDQLASERHDNLKEKLAGVSAMLSGFMARVEGMIDGSIQTAQSRQGAELVADYQRWRARVDDTLDQQAVLNGQVRLLGRIAVLLASTNVLALFAAIYAVVK